MWNSLFRMADYRKLRVWQEGHALAISIEELVEKMRKGSTRDLCDQLSRAARSIPTNIAEGSEYESYFQYARYLQYSLGSTSELEEHVQTARDINAMSYADFENLMKRITSERRQLKRFREKVLARGEEVKKHRKTRRNKKRKP